MCKDLIKPSIGWEKESSEFLNAVVPLFPWRPKSGNRDDYAAMSSDFVFDF